MKVDIGRPAIDTDRPTTPAQLHAFFSRLGFRIASRPVMPGMTAPMEAFWHIYARTYAILQLMGGRGSGKTRGLSLVEAAKAKFNDGYSISHVGATRAQAHRCYNYYREYVGPGGPLQGDVAKTRLTDTVWRNGSHMEVMPGTLNAVSGGHPVLMSIDEFDLLDQQVFQQAIGMPQTDVAAGYNSQIVLTSALYNSNGTMRTLLNTANPPTTLRWTVIDAMEPCDGRYGRPACADAIAVHNGGPVSNPPACALWDVCQGRAQYATGHKAREDVVNEFDLTDDFTWRTQYMSEDAQRAGTVYDHFDPDLSDDGSTNVTLAAEFDPNLEVYWGCDDGYEDPTVILLCQRTPDGTLVVFDEIYETHKRHDQILDMVCQPAGLDERSDESFFVNIPGNEPRGSYSKPRRAYVDASAKQLQMSIGQRLKSAARVRFRGERISEGIQLVRRLIQTNRGDRRLLIHPRCVNTIRELTYWRLKMITPGVWSDDPEPNEGGSNPDHACDSLRYISRGLFGRLTTGAPIA